MQARLRPILEHVGYHFGSILGQFRFHVEVILERFWLHVAWGSYFGNHIFFSLEVIWLKMGVFFRVLGVWRRVGGFGSPGNRSWEAYAAVGSKQGPIGASGRLGGGLSGSVLGPIGAPVGGDLAPKRGQRANKNGFRQTLQPHVFKNSVTKEGPRATVKPQGAK